MQENIKQVIVKNTVRKEFKTAPIWQWDTGHVLVFEGFNLPEAFQVHFAFSESGDSVPQIGSNDQVTVPDALVEDGRMIYAWLYISTEDAGLTKFVILMPVNRRAKPTHQVPPHVEHSEIEQAIVVLNAAVVRTETAAENAEQSEENASQYAENAYNSSVAAANAAESAEGDARTATEKAQEAITAALDADRKAQNASESAQLASQKASDASGFADGLAEAVRTANEAKQTAVSKANEANQSATNAAQKAQEATSAASSASQSATDADTAKRGAETAKDAAQGYAGNASTSAQAAETAKDTAVQKAGEAGQSATNSAQSAQAAAQTAQQFAQDITQLKSDIESKPDIDDTAGEGDTDKTWSADKLVSELQNKADVIISSASGAIASFPDGAAAPVEKLVVNVEPVQDLNGYDHPWPAGGGKNLFENTASTTTINGVTFTVNDDGTVSASGTATADVRFDLGYWTATGETVIFNGCPVGGSTTTYRQFADYIGPDIGTGASGTPTAGQKCNVRIQIYNGYTANNLLFKPMIRLSSIADGTFAPYSNICPITGWDSVEVTRTGKNLFDDTDILDLSKWIEAGGGYKLFPITLPPNTYKAILYGNFVNKGYVFIRIIRNGGYQNFYVKTGREESFKADFDVEEFDELYLASNVYSQDRLNQVWSDMYLSITTSDHSTIPEEQPKSSNVNITLPTEAGTVYGGELTINADGSGSLVVDRVMVEYDGSSDETWGEYAIGSENYCCVAYPSGKVIGYQKSICNEFKNQNGAFGSSSYGIYSDHPSLVNTYFRMPNAEVTTRAEFLTWIAEHPIQLCYELATPITYTLTASQITTLLGENNIWADTGDVAVKYNADTKLYIDNKIAELVAQIVNS